MNHASLAREALRFRLSSVHRALDPARFDLDGAAAFAVSCGDPVVDSAIRRVGTAPEFVTMIRRLVAEHTDPSVARPALGPLGPCPFCHT